MDKQQIKQNIETAFTNFESAIEKHEDVNAKRADGGWSVGEIGDHMLKSSGADFGNTQKTDRAYDKHAESIKQTFLDFNQKFPAAPNLQPEERQYNRGELKAALESNKDALLKMIDENDLTETCTDLELPGWGHLTRYELLVLIENHTIRHTKQVNDFKSK